MTDYTQAFADIEAQVSGAVPGALIVRTHDEIPTDHGLPVPYIVLTFGGPVKYARDKALGASRDNPNTMWVNVQSVAVLDDIARDNKIKVLNALEDFVPNNSSRMVPDGGFATDTRNDVTLPIRFVHNTRFSFIHNL